MTGMSVRKVGVEEELLLVDPDSGELTAVSAKAIRAAEEARAGERTATPTVADVEHELFLQQIETATAPCKTLDDLADELGRCRRVVGEAAWAAGAAAVAVPTPVLLGRQGHITPKDRYQRISDEYGEMTRQSLVCAMHMHVDIDSDEEAVAVIDRIRPWLPVLLAISGNSPFWQGRDTGFASWRSQIWSRWPSAGPAEPFTDPDTYRETAGRLVEWGAALDPGMLYYDVRLAQRYPTVEIRVADVCTDVDTAVLVAGLGRALVTTVAEGWRKDRQPLRWRTDLLRAAGWRAARYGVSGRLVHPEELRLVPVREAFEGLLRYTHDALDEAGDVERIRACFDKVMAGGSGAARQRSVLEAAGDLTAVVADLRERTEACWRPR